MLQALEQYSRIAASVMGMSFIHQLFYHVDSEAADRVFINVQIQFRPSSLYEEVKPGSIVLEKNFQPIA